MTDETKSRRPLNEIHDLREDLIRASDAYLAHEYGFINNIETPADTDTKQEALKLLHFSLIRYYRRIRPHIQKRDKLWEELDLWGEEQGLQALDEWVLKHTSKEVKTIDNNLKQKNSEIHDVAVLEAEKIIEAVDKLLEATERLGFDVKPDEKPPTYGFRELDDTEKQTQTA